MDYWLIFGWGSYDSNTHSIITDVYPSIISGFYLSLIEFKQGHRSRIQWKQVQDRLIICELEKYDKNNDGVISQQELNEGKIRNIVIEEMRKHPTLKGWFNK